MSDKLFKHPALPISKFKKTTTPKLGERKLSFCFEFCSFKEGHICFNNPQIESKYFIKIIECLKDISRHTISEIFKRQKELRFHQIDLKHKPYYLSEIYKKTINFNENGEQIPHLWQLEVFTDNKKNIAPRITFYILRDGVAKIVFYDHHHLLCSQIYPQDKNVPDNWYAHYYNN
ncbi:MAG: hypothetical protein HQ541_07315 [Mariniphaga sp.]|nr:hypothetical protein [Mariniphaga sp.]